MPFLCAAFLCGCEKNSGGANEPSNTDTSFSVTESVADTATLPDTPAPDESDTGSTTPFVKPITAGAIPLNKNSLYGEKTGTSSTCTGLEPLPVREFRVSDPENAKGLSTAARNHSFGVSKNGEPHRISIENQQYYEKYGALTLDTSGERVIYLTFDCGYENGYTEKILDTLLEKQVPAAFFVTLPYLKSSPKIAARMINEGHTVGNHSSKHPNFTTVNRTRMAQELQAVDDYLRQNFGYSSPYFRFPEGACSDSSLELVCSLGYTSVFWSAAYADWDVNNQKGADYAYDTVTSRLHPGCVLLLHVASADNAAALGRIIDYAQSDGYTFVPLG